jgi:hypothetical protein
MGTSKNHPSAAFAAAPAILTYYRVRCGRGFAAALHLGGFKRSPEIVVFRGANIWL